MSQKKGGFGGREVEIYNMFRGIEWGCRVGLGETFSIMGLALVIFFPLLFWSMEGSLRGVLNWAS